MDEPGFLARIVGKAAYEFAEVQDLIPTYIHIILAALFPIYIASHASLSRPSSAAKPTKEEKKLLILEDEDEDDESKPRMEGLSPTDAIIFPLSAGVALTSLYFLLKWDKDLLNRIMNWYMGLAGLYGTIMFLSDSKHLLHTLIFPSFYSDGSRIWLVKQNEKQVVPYSSPDEKSPKTTPLPGLLSHLPLPAALRNLLWKIRGIPQSGAIVKFYIHNLVAVRSNINLYKLTSFIEGCALVAYFTFVDKPWYLTNLMGFSFSYTALQIISPTTFNTGSLVLVGLFFYDIYMVFFTPMMVTVAKNLDIPVKLLFPRPTEDPAKQQFSMLGLGDIVLPGIVMGLALRYDLYLHYLRKQKAATIDTETKADATGKELTAAKPGSVIKASYVSPSKQWSNQFWTSSRFGFQLPASFKIPDAGRFSKTYFNASIIGYVLGMITTLVAMHVSEHPQPALLYLVPGVLISLWGTALVRGELSLMWNFTEEEEVDEEDDDAKQKKAGQDGEEEKVKKHRKGLFASLLGSNDDNDDEAHKRVAKRAHEDEDEKAITKEERVKPIKSKKVLELERLFQREIKNDILFFSVSKHIPEAKVSPKWVAPADNNTNGEPPEKRLRTA
ncbi:hypothetical protein BT63DRAFT_424850 [Microthyrium microscopicum]|uniref:Signal peptide peptidase n=1 Tax=Microthyrium microscopicum TaxID=703497 RepID=A0A6A6UB10_9PEZI|nr:hypothetical protein BT63DRAFT_424850 [Microthyrium microscopicum]